MSDIRGDDAIFRAGYLLHECVDATGTCPVGHGKAAVAWRSGAEPPIADVVVSSAVAAPAAAQEPRTDQADARLAAAYRFALSDLRARGAAAHPRRRAGSRHADQRARR